MSVIALHLATLGRPECAAPLPLAEPGQVRVQEYGVIREVAVGPGRDGLEALAEEGKVHGSAQCPNAKYSRRDQCQHRTDPHEDKQRLIILDDSIDQLKRSDEAAVVQAPDARHDDGRKGEEKAGNQRTQKRCQHQDRVKDRHVRLQ